MAIRRVAALITSFNRKELTLASLASLFQQEGISALELVVFLVDDGSKDGTGEAVRKQFPRVRVIQGDGSLFWNGGMRVAFDAAMKEGFDAYVWFNDDTRLAPNALRILIACADAEMAKGKPAIIVGSVSDPKTGARTYGGFRRQIDGLRVHFPAVEPDPSVPLPCDTMNGNFTLIPAAAAKAVGNLDAIFRHQIGDMDYGLRAKKAGFNVLMAPGYCGVCTSNSDQKTWRDPAMTRKQRWTHLMSPKGAPPREWFTFTRRHYGWRWLHHAILPYLKTLLR